MRNRLVHLYHENPAALMAGIFALLAILFGLWMSVAFTAGPFPYEFPHRFHRQIDSPVLALELARDAADVAAVTQTNDRTNPDPGKVASAQKALLWNTVFDCAFIPLYSGYLLFFGLAYAPRYKFSFVLLIAGVALFDYTENAFMFVTLGGGTPYEYYPSAIKWTLLGVALITLARVLVSANPGPYSKPTRRLLALLFAAAGVLIVLGLFVGPYSWLAFGSQLFAYTFVINAIGLFGPALAIPGKRQAFVNDFCKKRTELQAVGPAVREIPLGDDGSPAVQR